MIEVLYCDKELIVCVKPQGVVSTDDPGGMPLYGDRHYGSAVKNADVALWSRRLSFRHPVTGEEMVFEELPLEVKPWSRFAVPEQ